MKRGTTGHVKFDGLRLRLSLRRWEAQGLLEAVWHFAGQFTPAGDIGRYSDEQIARWVEWDRTSPEEMVAALVAERWLDVDAKHRLVVHDWPQHADQAVHIQLARARSYFHDGSAPRPRLNNLNSGEREEIGKFYKENPRAKAPRRRQSRATGAASGASHGSSSGAAVGIPSPPSTPLYSTDVPKPQARRGAATARGRNREPSGLTPPHGNGDGHKLERGDSHPSIATPDRVLELVGSRFPDLRLTRTVDDADRLHAHLVARCEAHPSMGDFMHWAEQLERQRPFLIQGRGRHQGPADLCWLMRDEQIFADVRRRKFETDSGGAQTSARGGA